MQIVHFTGPDVGSFDWELPKQTADMVSSLPLEAQGIIIDELKRNIQAFLLTLSGTLLMGPRILDALDVINKSQAGLSKELIAMAQKEIEKRK